MWFMGRSDDVVKIAGNRTSTAEVESALMGNAVVEAAVIGKPPQTAKEQMPAFAMLKKGVNRIPGVDQKPSRSYPLGTRKNFRPSGIRNCTVLAQNSFRQNHATRLESQGTRPRTG
jgi:acyl-coenzyme A synthetase/AMP-(fatty) acid ligase